MSSFFAFMSKKIAMPNDTSLACLAWEKKEGWLCCGAANGLVKVLRMEQADGTGKPAISSFTLEGHCEESARVIACCWNHDHRKLTTADASGLIIVWVLHRGQWQEEMLNNRQRSFVTDMHWSPDGTRICIAYQDGAVIVGKVDGARVWGKDLNVQLDKLQWSADGQNILFSNGDGELLLYDADGNLISPVSLACSADKGPSAIAGMHWYATRQDRVEWDQKVLAVALVNGMLQLMSSHNDKQPIIIDTMLRVRHIKWNPAGTLLVVAGSASVTAAERQEVSVLRFYTNTGALLYQLRVPKALAVDGVDWSGNGLQLAVAAGTLVYTVNVRPNYKWAFFNRTLAYAYTTPERSDTCVMFWDTQSDERHVKYSQSLLALAAHGQHCALLTRGEARGTFAVIVCNGIGSPVDSRQVHFEPTMLAVTSTHVVLCNSDVVYVWNFCTAQGKLTALEGRFGTGAALTHEHIFHIKEGGPAHTGPMESYVIPDDINAMPITAVTANENFVLLARRDGLHATVIHKFSLPDLQQLDTIKVTCPESIQSMWINCDASQVALLDMQGGLRILDLKAQRRDDTGDGCLLDFYRKDVWAVRWAEDLPDMLALLEKTKLVVLRGLEPEEPVNADGYLISFGNLEAKMVDMDQLMSRPAEPDSVALSLHETRSLMETRAMLEGDMEEAFKFAETAPHGRLWLLLAEAALGKLNFGLAAKAFVLKDDYKGIQFVKQVQNLDDKRKQNAEVAAYFKDFAEAERIYIGMGRPDLAISLRKRMGHWERVQALVKSHLTGDDKLMAEVHENIGQGYMDRRKWQKAVKYFVLSKQSAKLADCFFEMNDFDDLKDLMDVLPEGDPILKTIAERMEAVGMCEEAVQGFVKVGMVQRAIDCCSQLNQWDLAVQLAQAYDMHADNLLNKQAARLLEQGRKIDAVYLYQKARQHDKAARILVQLAKKAQEERATPMRIKKLYVLVAFEVEQARSNAQAANSVSGLTLFGLGAGAGSTVSLAGTRAAATLQGLVTLDAAAVQGEETMDRAWRGAEAYHFWMLVHRQMFEGNMRAAVRTALNLRRYDDVLPVEDVFSVLALVAYYGGFFEQCSKAFMKLEALESNSEQRRQALEELARAIFVQNPPVDGEEINEARDAPGADLEGTDLDGSDLQHASLLQGLSSENDLICVASGQVIKKDRVETTRCTRCRHLMIVSELQIRDPRTGSLHVLQHCPLCHNHL